jgi:DNA-binding MarR family transcriptional regulator
MGNTNKQPSVESEPTTEALAGVLRRSIYRVVKSFERADRLLVEPMGVTVSQAYALLTLPTQARISMGELSERLDVAGSTATRMVDQLVRKGIVFRAPTEEDRRVWSVGLTQKGLKVRDRLEEKFRHFFSTLAERFPEEERGELVSSMEKVTTVLADFVEAKTHAVETATPDDSNH